MKLERKPCAVALTPSRATRRRRALSDSILPPPGAGNTLLRPHGVCARAAARPFRRTAA